MNEAVISSRACFNHDSFRNLEGYLKLIVRFATPEPQETFVLYQDAVERVREGESIGRVLTSPDFRLERGEYPQDQFWRVLVNRASDFDRGTAEAAIDTLVEYLPRYSLIANKGRGLRQRSIYSLLRLLDSAGWGKTSDGRVSNDPENIKEIAWRIFGEYSYAGNGLLRKLAAIDRGVLGWYDLTLFRLQCSADRQGQLYNLQAALIVDQDETAATTGAVSKLALLGMRKLSQEVFSLFKQTYIESKRNFLSEVNEEPIESFFGEAPSQFDALDSSDDQSEFRKGSLAQRVSAERSLIKSFVLYQLSNSRPPAGSGVGCGYYDERGGGDNGGIAKAMNDYMFGVCFNPEIDEDNALHFIDYCLSNLSSSFFSGNDEEGYFASKAELPGGLDSTEMGAYWTRHREHIRRRVQLVEERQVVTSNYIASYREDLDGVYAVLEELAEGISTVEA